jgi:hypothetical protein
MSQQHRQRQSHELVLDLFAPYTSGPYDLVQLSAVSQAAKAACARYIEQHLPSLLLPLVRCTAHQPANTTLLQQQNIGTIKQLCRLAGSSALQALTAELVTVPGVPQAAVDALLRSGVRISYEQLLAAAKRQQDDIENWVQLGFTALPEAIEQIACPSEVSDSQLLKNAMLWHSAVA